VISTAVPDYQWQSGASTPGLIRLEALELTHWKS